MILAFDLAKCTGWAAADRGRLPVCGEVDLLPVGVNVFENQGRAFSTLRQTGADLIAVHSPREIWVEEPVPTSRGGLTTMRWLMGLAAIIDELGATYGIPVFDVLPKTARLQVLGDGGAEKPDIAWWCAENGWWVPGDNAADALILLAYAACCEKPLWTLTPGPSAQAARDDIFAKARS